ncbi:serine/threonine protein kinase [Paraliomyxa miuraensis]|uniref:serine/threonine protein kinase n=1 Tax=Paraliomyxa miuraensis TaxID=376150 RepID=UPI0022521D15|nr:serine/threonine-protein kinase [Paraliomyxa miuraensis]MCX4240557.1 serine/threonine protein kinase [Paraliomyxa miuraensis]
MALELKVGDTHEDFQVLQVLRKYPHAWVYKVRAPGHDEPVALKLSLDPVRDEEAARRALREVAVLESLTNAHVLKVHGSGLTSAEHWFILMEHLPGAQLNHWHDFDRPLPAADAVGFVHQACLGLAELHAVGVVHRDLRPERLWITPDGTVKLLDFSSARSWGEGATADNVTVGVQVAGSPEYTAPEQAFGTELSPATDVYSLGVMLYEMLTGKSPLFPALSWSESRSKHADDPGAWMRAHARVPPAPLREHAVAAELPQKLADVLAAALAKDSKARPATAGELANELGWVLHHDLGAAQAGILKVSPVEGLVEEGLRPRYALVLPGSHRVGTGAVELRVADQGDDAVLAVIEWAGAPKPAELVAHAEGITMNGNAVTERVAWEAGSTVVVGGVRLQLTYPKG